MRPYDSVDLIVSGVVELSTGLLRGNSSGNNYEVESFALHQLDCVEHKRHWCTVFLKDNIVINSAFSNI